MQSETKFVELVIVNDNSQVSHLAGNKLRYFMCLLLKDQGLVSRKTQTFYVGRQILNQNLLNSCTVPSPQTSQFCFGTDSFIVLFSKLLKL